MLSADAESDPGPDRELAFTGSATVVTALAAAGLLAAGCGTVVVARRRRGTGA